jgi:serine/threonine protein kinase
MAGKSTPIAHLEPLEIIPEPAEQPTRVGLPANLLGPIRDCPDVPGYDILAELGRGGMGVVYLARQLRLKRVVALKMLRPGLHAEAEARLRFAGEAQAVAKLRHPGIVQIHDVGEAAGRPYLALEFVEGGSLAQFLAGKPQPPHRAAELLATLARAIEHAHEHGIIHRDLKPSNVLLGYRQSAVGDRPEDGVWPTADGRQPIAAKITDFGLAKQLSEDSHLTRSGCALGGRRATWRRSWRSACLGPSGPPWTSMAWGRSSTSC